MTHRALAALYAAELPERGAIRVEFHEDRQAGVTGVIANVVSMLTGAMGKQLEYKTGGPSAVENLYIEQLLRETFADMDILEEGSGGQRGHWRRSALIDLVARRKTA